MKTIMKKMMAFAMVATMFCSFNVIKAEAANLEKTVKAQITAGVNGDSESSSIRLLCGVDSLEYNQVGFYVVINGVEKKVSTTKVYSEVKEGDKYVAAADIFSGAAYIAAVQLDNIANADFANGIYVKPYWVDKAGVKTVGTDRYVRVANGYDGSFSVAVRVDGDDIAAALVGINYDDATLEYLGYDGGTILGEYATADFGGVVKFVGNVSDITSDMAADGMIINLNFKAKNVNGVAFADDYEFSVANTEFCNVAEMDVTDVSVTLD